MLNGISRLGAQTVKSVQKIARSVSSSGKPPLDQTQGVFNRGQNPNKSSKKDRTQLIERKITTGQSDQGNTIKTNIVNEQESKQFIFGKAPVQRNEKTNDKVERNTEQPKMEKSNLQNTKSAAPLRKSKLFVGKDEQQVVNNRQQNFQKLRQTPDEVEQEQGSIFSFVQQTKDKPTAVKRSASAEVSDMESSKMFKFDKNTDRQQVSDEPVQASIISGRTNT